MPISLFPHNLKTMGNVLRLLKEKGRALVIQPPGTGKMFIGLKLAEFFNQVDTLYLAPSIAILHGVKKVILKEGMTKDFSNLKRMTYQKLTLMSEEEFDKLHPKVIILDEIQFCGAPEYGDRVKRLLKNNPKALLLGLTADGVRYFDGFRDMGEELFPGCVANRMTFEDAMEQGILPEATYVSALYGYIEELKALQKRIDETENSSNKEQAQALFNRLKEELDANVENLGELFKKYMKPNGKYIVFCKNIEDMNEKMKQAQEMFGKVNSNITVRAVSSKLRDNERVLTEFEQDDNADTLKLMFAVNMLNLGYHTIDMDGVIMMRPTHSPGLFIQQLGKAFSVGGNKIPLIIDLVNNYDSCKIIADLAERMKKYFGNEPREKKEKENKRKGITIFDSTQNFREVIENIWRLTTRSQVSLEEKINIFEEFAAESDEIIRGDTTYQGYPIGQWAIQIRAELKKQKNDESAPKKINPTEEQLERLEKLGLLEGKIKSSLNEKIDSMIEWRKEYPLIPIRPSLSRKLFRELIGWNPDFDNIFEQYKKILELYTYVAARFKEGKLDKEQIERCREGNVGGVFGLSTKEKSENQYLMKEYGLQAETINAIKKRFGSIEAFRKLYIEAMLKDNANQFVEDNKNLLSGLNLITIFDISSPDWALRKGVYTDFISENIRSSGRFSFTNYKKIVEVIDYIFNNRKFSENEEFVFKTYHSGIDTTYATIAEQIGLTGSRVGAILSRSCRKVYHNTILLSNTLMKDTRYNVDSDIWQEIVGEYFKHFDIFVPKEPRNMEEAVRNKLNQMLRDGVNKTRKRAEDLDILLKMPIQQQIDILKAKFGDRIKISDLIDTEAGDTILGDFEIDVGLLVNEDKLKRGNLPFGLDKVTFYRECVDSEFVQSKILEFKIGSISDAEILEEGKKEELEASIDNNNCLDELRKKELKDVLVEKIKNALKERIVEKIEKWSVFPMNVVDIEELHLSTRTCYCVKRVGFDSIYDFEGKSIDDLLKIRDLGNVSYNELLEKLKQVGFIIDEEGCFHLKNTTSNISMLNRIDEEINSNSIFGEAEKEELRLILYDKFTKKTDEIGMNWLSENKPETGPIIQKIIEARKNLREKERQEALLRKAVKIEELKFEKRVFNALRNAEYNTIPEFIGKNSIDLQRIRSLGSKGIGIVLEKLENIGIVFGDDGELIFKPELNHPQNEKEELLRKTLLERQAKYQKKKDDAVVALLEKQGIINEQGNEINRLKEGRSQDGRTQ